MSWELNRQIPTDFIAQKANSSERAFLISILEAGVTYVADRGYFSFDLAEKVQKAAAFFILSNGKKIKYLFGGRDLLLRSGIFCVRSSATGNKNNETSVTKVIS